MRDMRKWSLITGCLLMLLPWPHLVAAPNADLPRKIESAIDERIVPAYLRGDPYWLLTELSELVARADQKRVTQIDQRLAQDQLPPVGQLMMESRLSLVLQGRGPSLPKPHPREMLLTVEPLVQAIESTLNDAKSVDVLAEPFPQVNEFARFEQMFWDAHVFRNRLRTSRILAEYGQAIQTQVQSVREGVFTAADKKKLEADFSAFNRRLQELTQHLEERVVRLRLERLNFAANLNRKGLTFLEQMTAAYLADLDGELLEQFLTEHRDFPFQDERLRAPGTLRDVQVRAKRVREQSADLVRKGRLLFEGLHWWMRGRYGEGPEGNGMLKSSLALSDPIAMFALYMPVETPRPTDPYDADAYPIPEIDRRHHYIWQFEYRRIDESQWTHTETHKSDEKIRVTSVTKLKRFY